MSIPYDLNKIKGRISPHQNLILSIVTMVVVALASFGLGRLSTGLHEAKEAKISEYKPISTFSTITSKTSNNRQSASARERVSVESIPKQISGNFVASKNGKLYYKPTCAGAKRIKDANRVWFESSIEAEKAGYSRSTSCK